MERASKEKTENSTDDDAGPHPDFGPSGGYKGDTSKLGKGEVIDIGAARKKKMAQDSGGIKKISPSEVDWSKVKPAPTKHLGRGSAMQMPGGEGTVHSEYGKPTKVYKYDKNKQEVGVYKEKDGGEFSATKKISAHSGREKELKEASIKSDLSKGAFKDKWIKQQEDKGKDPLDPPSAAEVPPEAVRVDQKAGDAHEEALHRRRWGLKKKSGRTNPLSISEYTRRKEGSSGSGQADEGYYPDEAPEEIRKKDWKAVKEKHEKAGTSRFGKSRPNPIKGGEGDDLEYDDVDEKELEEGVKVEQEHVKNSDDDEDKKKVKAADIALDHLAEDDKYYTKLAEMERSGKEGDKAETKKKKLLKIVDKSFRVSDLIKDKSRPVTSEKKIRHEKALESRAEKTKEEWAANAELEKLSEIKGKKLDRKRY
jgi:hypothetical protein